MIIIKEIHSVLQEIKKFHKEDFQNVEQECNEPEIEILTKECNGLILYTWMNRTENVSNSESHIAYIDLGSNIHKEILCFKPSVAVVSCTIDETRSIAAYTTENISEAENKVYRTYLVELFQNGRTFSLNLEREVYINVQFIYGNVLKDVVHLLVMIHYESIGVYTVSLKSTYRGMTISEQPKTERIVRRLVWCEWDGHSRCLYYIRNKHTKAQTLPAPRKRVPDSQTNMTSLFSCIQFNQDGKYSFVMELPLTTWIDSNPASSFHKEQFINKDFSFSGISVMNNIRVLTRTDGTLCICQQYSGYSMKLSLTEDGDSQLMDIQYYVTLPHHARILCATVKVPIITYSSLKLIFFWFKDYLAVCLPGIFLHLLNVNIQYEPVHHILLHRDTCMGHIFKMQFAYAEHREMSEELSDSAAELSRDDMFNNDLLTEDEIYTNPHFYHVLGVGNSKTKKHLLEIETEERKRSSSLSDSISTGAECYDDSIEFHKAARIMNVKSPLPTNQQHSSKLLLHLTSDTDFSLIVYSHEEDSNSSDIVSFLYDFNHGVLCQVELDYEVIISHFYHDTDVNSRLSILHFLIKCHVDEDSIFMEIYADLLENQRPLELSTLFSEYLVASTYAKVGKFVNKDFLRYIPFTAAETFRSRVHRGDKGGRIAVIRYELMKKVNLGIGSTSKSTPQNSTGIIWDNLSRHLLLQQLNLNLRFVPSQLKKKYKELKHHKETKENSESPGSSNSGIISLKDLTESVFTNSILQHKGKDYKDESMKVSREYTNVQTMQATHLLQLICSLCAPELTNYNRPGYLLRPASDDDLNLFYAMEKLLLACWDVSYPVPADMILMLTSLGFRVLNLYTFLQYVDSGALVLDKSFISLFIRDIPNSDHYVDMKLHLFSRLSNIDKDGGAIQGTQLSTIDDVMRRFTTDAK